MYYPKNKIKTNLYTKGGEFLVVETVQQYVGYYWASHTGNFFTGKTPNDKPQRLLTRLGNDNVTDPKTFNPPYLGIEPKESLNKITNQASNTINNRIYSIITDQLVETERIIPFHLFISPSEKDYQLGGFMRYFTVRTNEAVYAETNKKHYDAILQQDPRYALELITPFKIFWTLIGKRDQVSRANKNITELTAKRLKKNGLTQFLEGNYLQFYREDGSSTPSQPTITTRTQPIAVANTPGSGAITQRTLYTPPTPSSGGSMGGSGY